MNNSDPLAQLRDIHLPQEIGFWPLAAGWWVIIVLVAIAVTVSIWLLVKKELNKRNQYRRSAQAIALELWNRYHETGDAPHYLAELTRLLRRTAITAYPDYPVHTLTNLHWLRFLDATNKGDSHDFCNGIGKAVISLPYQRNIDQDLAPLHQCIALWLANHQPQPSIPAQTIERIFADANVTVKKRSADISTQVTGHA